MAGKKIMRCLCGKLAYVKDVMDNPTPENQSPCIDCYKKICKLREQKARGVTEESSATVK